MFSLNGRDDSLFSKVMMTYREFSCGRHNNNRFFLEKNYKTKRDKNVNWTAIVDDFIEDLKIEIITSEDQEIYDFFAKSYIKITYDKTWELNKIFECLKIMAQNNTQQETLRELAEGRNNKKARVSSYDDLLDSPSPREVTCINAISSPGK
jgi:hypothetical protein